MSLKLVTVFCVCLLAQSAYSTCSGSSYQPFITSSQQNIQIPQVIQAPGPQFISSQPQIFPQQSNSNQFIPQQTQIISQQPQISYQQPQAQIISQQSYPTSQQIIQSGSQIISSNSGSNNANIYFQQSGSGSNSFGSQNGISSLIENDFNVVSGSPRYDTPAGVSISSENQIGGSLSVSGTLPFFGATSFDGSVDSNGQASVSFGSGTSSSLTSGGCSQGLYGSGSSGSSSGSSGLSGSSGYSAQMIQVPSVSMLNYAPSSYGSVSSGSIGSGSIGSGSSSFGSSSYQPSASCGYRY